MLLKNSIRSIIFLSILYLVIRLPLQSQTSLPNIIEALKINYAINLDGKLDEECWSQVKRISNFTQREISNGEPPTELTEVGICYNKDYLFIGVWCYDKEPDKIITKSMQRDFAYWEGDNFEVLIDTYNDKRNGYLFVTNPSGARADILIAQNGDAYNDDWNGVWDVAAEINGQGWFAEFEIPFTSLKFSEQAEQVWGINFERNIRRKREQLLWQNWSRDNFFEMVSGAGHLIGLKDIKSCNLLELKPFTLGGFEKIPSQDANSVLKIGGDINYLISPTLKVNLTANTDFAQVESDVMQINLTRFSLFYPEKREFFLEGKDFFTFNFGDERIFYSRQIGLLNRQEVPILAGGRLVGKVGNTNLGVLTMQTSEKDTLPSTNFSVVRVKQDIFERSSIGVILTAKNLPGHYNYVYGTDFNFSTPNFLGNKNLTILASIAQSQTQDLGNTNNLIYGAFIGFPNDIIRAEAYFIAVQKNFNPEIGFLNRTNYKRIGASFKYAPRPDFIPFIQQFVFKPLDINIYLTDETNELESFTYELRPLAFETKSGEYFEFDFQQYYDRVDVPFNLYGQTIPAGKYWFSKYRAEFETYRGRSFVVNINADIGKHYTASGASLGSSFKWNLSPKLNITGGYQKNYLELPDGVLDIDEFITHFTYSFNTKLFTSLFAQWNNIDEAILVNFRINWIPNIGSDFYLVFNQKINTMNQAITFQDFVVIAKLIWRFPVKM